MKPKLVLDASIAIKWMVPTEVDAAKAIDILERLRRGELEVIQPVHWMVEVLGVTTRIDPTLSLEALELLYELALPVKSSKGIDRLAVDIARSSKVHVFDALYHSLAIDQQAELVTADRNYYRRVDTRGNIVELHRLP